MRSLFCVIAAVVDCDIRLPLIFVQLWWLLLLMPAAHVFFYLSQTKCCSAAGNVNRVTVCGPDSRDFTSGNIPGYSLYNKVRIKTLGQCH